MPPSDGAQFRAQFCARTRLSLPLHAGLVACFFVGLLLPCFLAPIAHAKSSPHPITDNDIRDKKQNCYADIESGLWGWKYRSSMIEKENCALRCLSPVCYQLIYESDPLEEGENDFVRGQEFKFCMRKEKTENDNEVEDSSKRGAMYCGDSEEDG